MTKDIIVIGGGPAGLTAALYALRAGKSVLVIEKAGLGGQIALSDKVENFPGLPSVNGMDFAEKLATQVMDLGGEIEYETVVSVIDGDEKVVTTDFGSYTAKAVIVATGVKNRQLGAKNEDKFIGRGVSFCAVCDGSFYKDKTVAVVGGGNTALEDAEYLSEIASKVYLIHRRDEFRGEAHLVNRLKELPNVEFILNSTVSEFKGGDIISGIEITNTKTGEKSDLILDGVFEAVGKIPQNEIFEGLIDLTDEGYVDSREDCLTKANGVFVAGDCRQKQVRQLTTAVGDGSVAALAAIAYINEGK